MSWGMVRFFVLAPGQTLSRAGSRIRFRCFRLPDPPSDLTPCSGMGSAVHCHWSGGVYGTSGRLFFGRACYSGASAAVPPLHFRHPACSLPFSPVSFLSC